MSGESFEEGATFSQEAGHKAGVSGVALEEARPYCWRRAVIRAEMGAYVYIYIYI
jgi:hypothetical protein